MPFAGKSHFGLIAALGVLIAVMFAVAARATRASRRQVGAALAGGLLAGGVNVATDAAAFAAGFWRYPEATTPFGPLLYYLEAGLGCGALALVALGLRRRFGRRALVMFLAGLALYAPIRDAVVAAATGLIEFHYEPFVVVVIADALSGFVIPVLVAYGVLVLLTPRAPAAPPPR